MKLSHHLQRLAQIGAYCIFVSMHTRYAVFLGLDVPFDMMVTTAAFHCRFLG